MSISPPIRRYPSANSRQEDLINAYEAEEERILNLLSRKLEQVRFTSFAADHGRERLSHFELDAWTHHMLPSSSGKRTLGSRIRWRQSRRAMLIDSRES